MELSTTTGEILAVTEHLVPLRMTNDGAAALAAYRSDPGQDRYPPWETPYPVDSARALALMAWMPVRIIRRMGVAPWWCVAVGGRAGVDDVGVEGQPVDDGGGPSLSPQRV